MATDNQENVIDSLAGHIEAIIRLLGEDPAREGLAKTPVRAAKALYFATSGYRSTEEETVGSALFESPSSGIVIVRDIEFYSMCEHHILPFFGKISVGYLPGEKIVGLSKVARLVNLFARRLQTQERFTSQVCEAVERCVDARGVIAVCQAGHLCMKMRGVEKQESTTATVATAGVFASDIELRREFFEALAVR